MALFDKNGNLNQSVAGQLYQSASSQVTGHSSQYSPMGDIQIIGTPTGLEEYESLSSVQLVQLKEMAVQSLSKGFPPETQVSISLQAMAQIVKTLESLGAFCEEGTISDSSEEEEGND